MSLFELLRDLRASYEGFNEPASKADLARLHSTFGPLPPDVLTLYADHDGAFDLPHNEEDDSYLAITLLPIVDVLELNAQMKEVEVPALGEILWLWADYSGNHLGLYMTGICKGWVARFNHEETLLIPAYRSITSLMQMVLQEAAKDEDHRPCDIIALRRDVPALKDDPHHVEADRRLAKEFFDLYDKESSDDARLLYGMSAICLTPVADTASLTRFFREDNLWLPEAAVQVMDMRDYANAVPELERLAKEGSGNGDSAAIRMLIRLESTEARQAVSRLQAELTGAKLQWLTQYLPWKGKLQRPEGIIG